MRFLSPGRAAAAVVTLAALVLVVLYLIPSNGSYVFIPDRAHALAPLVQVSGEHPEQNGGGLYFVDVRFRKARLLEHLLGRPLARNSTLVPASAVVGTGVSEKQQRRIDLSQMQESQKIATALALQRLGYRVPIRLPRVIVSAVVRSAPAAKLLRPGDRLLAIGRAAVTSSARLRQLIGAHRPGDRLRLRLERDGRVRSETVRTIADPADPRRPVVGILVRDVGASIGKLPVRVRIDTAGVGGPSAGLAFALDVMEELGRNVDRGYKVAATGELALDGTIVPIGAVKQKTIGAREADVDVFLVPAGANAREARRNADGLRIVPVQSFPQALHALATLPLKGRMNA